MTQVLIADDDPIIRETLAVVLTRAGYAVEPVSDGVAALRILSAAVDPMVVVLDVLMPELGGLGVLNAVADNPVLTARHAYMLITAYPRVRRPPAVDETIERLGVTVLYKPFDMQVFLDAVAERERRLLAPREESGVSVNGQTGL